MKFSRTGIIEIPGAARTGIIEIPGFQQGSFQSEALQNEGFVTGGAMLGQFGFGMNIGTVTAEAVLEQAVADATTDEQKAAAEAALATFRATQSGEGPATATLTVNEIVNGKDNSMIYLVGGALLLWMLMRK